MGSDLGDGDPCNACDAHAEHLRLAKLGRECYQKDREENEYDVEETLYLSSDMRKVIMLPRIPGYKTAVFKRRLTVYQTFSPIGKGQKTFDVIWHAGQQGRDEDLASAYIAALRSPKFRDYDYFVICMGGQLFIAK